MMPVYLDYGATTPLDPRVAAAMEPWGVEKFGNPHSAHRWGYEAAAAVALALPAIMGWRVGPAARQADHRSLTTAVEGPVRTDRALDFARVSLLDVQ